MNISSKIPVEKIPEAVALLRSKPLKEAMMELGYSEASAARGRASLPEAVQQALVMADIEANKELIDKGKLVTPEMAMNAVKGRLIENVLNGEDAGVQSAKLLGSWKEVDMFKNETVSGVIMLAPPSLMGARVIDGEVIEAPEVPKLPAGNSDTRMDTE